MAEIIGFSDGKICIRMYNTLNWPSYNTETLGFLNNNTNVQIIIATTTLSVGINSPVETVVIFRHFISPEDYVQMMGGIWQPLSQAWGIVYLPWGSDKAAH